MLLNQLPFQRAWDGSGDTHGPGAPGFEERFPLTSAFVPGLVGRKDPYRTADILLYVHQSTPGFPQECSGRIQTKAPQVFFLRALLDLFPICQVWARSKKPSSFFRGGDKTGDSVDLA